MGFISNGDTAKGNPEDFGRHKGVKPTDANKHIELTACVRLTCGAQQPFPTANLQAASTSPGIADRRGQSRGSVLLRRRGEGKMAAAVFASETSHRGYGGSDLARPGWW